MSDNNSPAMMLNSFIPYRMVNLATSISNACSKIYKDEFDITIPEWRILARLAEHDKLNAKDIGRVTFMDKSKVSRAVKTLDDKGYLLKEKNEADNRASYLSLTTEGRDLYNQIAPKALEWEKDLISILDASEYRDLMRILEKLDHQVNVIEENDS
ncbi:MarR family transcriptional regulator [Alteromonadaceae bacterium M269]|nr:MarR family transcriptional regulator [Alteromonadaceae bacterium M269]